MVLFLVSFAVISASEGKNVSVPIIYVATYARSGSCHLGALLSHHPGTFYSFEVLNRFANKFNREHKNVNDILDEGLLDEKFNFLHNIVNCTIENVVDYNKSFHKDMHDFPSVRKACNKETMKDCSTLEFWKEVCKNSDRQLIKDFQLPMKRMPDLIDSFPEKDKDRIKIVLLVRDPRGNRNSRKNRNLSCRNCDPINNSGDYCKRVMSDLENYDRLSKIDPDRYTLVKYEDMISKPEETARRLFNHLGIPFTEGEKEYLSKKSEVHAQTSPDSPKLLQDSLDRMSAWQHELTPREIRFIEMNCLPVLKRLNYSLYDPSA